MEMPVLMRMIQYRFRGLILIDEVIPVSYVAAVVVMQGL